MFITRSRSLVAIMALIITMPFTACDKDDPTPQPQPQAAIKTLSEINASDYSNWTYVNLETGATETHRDFTAWYYIDNETKQRVEIPAQGSPADVKIEWHIAFRRELVKTNNGAAAEVTGKKLDAVTKTDVVGLAYTGDAVETKNPLMIDFKSMMTGRSTYSTADSRNPVLLTWMEKKGRPMVDLTYTPTGKVFALRTKDNTYYAVQLTDFLNAKGTKGYITLSSRAL